MQQVDRALHDPTGRLRANGLCHWCTTGGEMARVRNWKAQGAGGRRRHRCALRSRWATTPGTVDLQRRMTLVPLPDSAAPPPPSARQADETTRRVAMGLPHAHRRTSTHSFGDQPRTKRPTSPGSMRSARLSACQAVSSKTARQALHVICDERLTWCPSPPVARSPALQVSLGPRAHCAAPVATPPPRIAASSSSSRA